MPNLLEQLENNEAVLLMYLSGELADEDRDEVAQMLSTDSRLRAELEQLRAATADVNATIGVADAHARLPITESVAVRNTLRAMRRWRLEHPYRPAAAVADKGLRYPWWAYPSSAAAMLLLAALVWWGMRSEPGWQGTSYVQNDIPANDVPAVVTSPDEQVASAPDEFAQADDLDQVYSELRNIQELANGM